MIQLSLVDGRVFVWNAKDWEKLRLEHRIVGNLVGCLAHLPRQDVFSGLPMHLLPEEVSLLLEKKIANLVMYPDLSVAPTKKTKEIYEEYKESIESEMLSFLESDRKRQVTAMIDKIVDGKRRKLMGLSTKRPKKARLESGTDENETEELEPLIEPEIDKDAVLRGELEKAEATSPITTLVQTFTEDPWLDESDCSPAVWPFPSTPQETFRCSVFRDFWEKGFYVTAGHKFGGDFLIYPGDPVKFHAQFIVVCMELDTPLQASDLVAYGRLGSSTRKAVVIAAPSADGQSIAYQTLQLAERIPFELPPASLLDATVKQQSETSV